MAGSMLFGLLGPTILLAAVAINLRMFWRHGPGLAQALVWRPWVVVPAILPGSKANVLPLRPRHAAAKSARPRPRLKLVA